MKRTEYRSALRAARQELDELTKERDVLDGRIARLQQTIASLETLCDEAPTFEQGLTDACRTVLKAAPQPLTALDVKTKLAALGVPTTKYSNAVASVHTVLKRLANSGEVSVIYGRGKPDAYQWTRFMAVMGSPARAQKKQDGQKDRRRGG